MNKSTNSFCVLVLVCLVLTSCISNEKLIFMQNLKDSTGPLVETSQKYPYLTEDYLLQINDIVEVTIKTTGIGFSPIEVINMIGIQDISMITKNTFS